MCFHPKSNVTVPLMTAAEMEAVVERWVEQAREAIQSKINWAFGLEFWFEKGLEIPF